MTRPDIFDAYTAERLRQEQLRAEGRFPHTCADTRISAIGKFAILNEEIGEVADAVFHHSGLSTDRTQADLKKELIHAGAVITAWLESIG